MQDPDFKPEKTAEKQLDKKIKESKKLILNAKGVPVLAITMNYGDGKSKDIDFHMLSRKDRKIMLKNLPSKMRLSIEMASASLRLRQKQEPFNDQ